MENIVIIQEQYTTHFCLSVQQATWDIGVTLEKLVNNSPSALDLSPATRSNVVI